MKRKLLALSCLGVVAAAGATALGQPVEVDMRGIAFSPKDIVIDAGMTVHWINKDFIPHTATSESGPDVLMPDGTFRSPFLNPMQTFDFTFNNPGTYFYYCEIHGQHMQGTVTVNSTCQVDFTGDGLVDFSDYLEFLNLYDSEDPKADLTQDGLVDFSDYLEFLNLFEAGC